MSRPARLALTLALTALAASSAVAPTAAPAAAGSCARRGDEVRFDDGRLLVERADRALDPRTVRERWWACWRPTGRRTLIADRRRPDAAPELALLGLRRGRFVLLLGGGRLDVTDARAGRPTARVTITGVLRELAVTTRGHAAALQDTPGGGSLLEGGDPARSCLLDAGPRERAGDVFGGLTLHAEHLTWQRDGTTLGADLDQLDCGAPSAGESA